MIPNTIITLSDIKEAYPMSSYLRLKVRELLLEKRMNLHQAHLAAGFSYPTMHRYQKYPGRIESLHTPSIVALLVDALGWSKEEIEATPMGHFFEVVTDNEGRPTDYMALTRRTAEACVEAVAGLGDPVLESLMTGLMDRIDELEGATEPAGEEQRRHEIIDFFIRRAMMWADLYPDILREDPIMVQIVQAGLLRLAELERGEREE